MKIAINLTFYTFVLFILILSTQITADQDDKCTYYYQNGCCSAATYEQYYNNYLYSTYYCPTEMATSSTKLSTDQSYDSDSDCDVHFHYYYYYVNDCKPGCNTFCIAIIIIIIFSCGFLICCISCGFITVAVTYRYCCSDSQERQEAGNEARNSNLNTENVNQLNQPQVVPLQTTNQPMTSHLAPPYNPHYTSPSLQAPANATHASYNQNTAELLTLPHVPSDYETVYYY